jgi:hypothetical protein
MTPCYSRHNKKIAIKFTNHDFALELAQFIDDIVFYIPTKFQRKILICKAIMIFELFLKKIIIIIIIITDFSFWKYQVELVLEQDQLLGVIRADEDCPQSNILEVVTNQEEFTLFGAKDVAARLCFITSMEDNCKRSLLYCTNIANMSRRWTVQLLKNSSRECTHYSTNFINNFLNPETA